MINTKQRAALRAMANQLEPIIHIGKAGITDHLVTQVDDALTARELIKALCRRMRNILQNKRCIFYASVCVRNRCRPSDENLCCIGAITKNQKLNLNNPWLFRGWGKIE